MGDMRPLALVLGGYNPTGTIFPATLPPAALLSLFPVRAFRGVQKGQARPFSVPFGVCSRLVPPGGPISSLGGAHVTLAPD